MEAAFAAYSEGRAVVPPVGELLFEDPPGDAHIKYGYVRGGEHFLVKVASGFYKNPEIGMPSSNGLMLLFDQRTGMPKAVLLDDGLLTDVRTAAAGAAAAKHLARSRVERIGIVGAGIQARLQLEHVARAISCRSALVWGRNRERARRMVEDLRQSNLDIELADSVSELAAKCEVIVTTTPSGTPLLSRECARPGMLIIAVGSDTPEKQELDVGVLAMADLVVADSKAQCLTRGEIHHAIGAGVIDESDIVEIGDIIRGVHVGRGSNDEIIVVDLTGVAVQDIFIAVAVLRALA
jgi:ornithine cyclodeaminase